MNCFVPTIKTVIFLSLLLGATHLQSFSIPARPPQPPAPWADFLREAHTRNVISRPSEIIDTDTYKIEPVKISMWVVPNGSLDKVESREYALPTSLLTLMTSVGIGNSVFFVPESILQNPGSSVSAMLEKYGAPVPTGLWGVAEPNGRTFVTWDPKSQEVFELKLNRFGDEINWGASAVNRNASDVSLSDLLALVNRTNNREPEHVPNILHALEVSTGFLNSIRLLSGLTQTDSPLTHKVLALHSLLGYSSRSALLNHRGKKPQEINPSEFLKHLLNLAKDAIQKGASTIEIRILNQIIEQKDLLIASLTDLQTEPPALTANQAQDLKTAQELLKQWSTIHCLRKLLVKTQYLSKDEKRLIEKTINDWTTSGKWPNQLDPTLLELVGFATTLETPKNTEPSSQETTDLLYPDWILKLAEIKNISPYEWLTTEYFPQLAKMEAHLHLAGIWGANHTQNIFALVDTSTGTLRRLVYKDLGDALVEPALLYNHAHSHTALARGISISNTRYSNAIRVLNMVEVGVHFREFSGQAIIFNPYLPDAAKLAATFVYLYGKLSPIEFSPLVARYNRMLHTLGIEPGALLELMQTIITNRDNPGIRFALSEFDSTFKQQLSPAFRLLQETIQTAHDALVVEKITQWGKTRDWTVLTRKKRDRSLDRIIDMARDDGRLQMFAATERDFPPHLWKQGVALKKTLASPDWWIFSQSGRPLGRIAPSKSSNFPAPIPDCLSTLRHVKL